MIDILEQHNVSSYNRIDRAPDIFEKAVIGCLIECNNKIAAKIAGQVSTDLISVPKNLHVYNILQTAAISGNKLGYSTAIASIIQSPGMLEFFRDEDDVELFIEECLETAEPIGSWEQYVKELHLAYTRRRLMTAFDDASVSALGARTAEDATADAISKVIDVAGDLRRNALHENYDMNNVVDRYLEIYKSDEGSAIRFPQHQLNTLGGYRAGDVVILCAGTGGKKSWVGIDWCLDAYNNYRKSSRIYTMEMSEEEVLNRIFSLEFGFDNEAMFNRKVDVDKIEDAAKKLAVMPISIVDKRISPGRILADLASMGDDRPDIILIDHLDLFSFKDGNEVNALKSALANFKDAAKQYGVVFLIIAQFRRPKSEEEAKYPHLGMLKGGSSIEQIASYVIFMNEELDRTQLGDYYQTKMWCAKQRHGKPVGKFNVEFKDYRVR